jgi:Glycosyltransferase family 25 (LPS biosynthesis protein)
MPPPQTWDEFLNGPAYIINMERQPERLQRSMERLKSAGFTNVIRWKAIDAKTDDIVAAWKAHGSPKFDPSDHEFIDVKNCPGKQGTLVSHMEVWKHIATSDAPWAVVFQDDIVFHKDWAKLGPMYFNETPKDYGLCYIGHYCGYDLPYHIVRVPIYCDQAVIITKEGASQLYNKMINDPNGIRTIDLLTTTYMALSIQYPYAEEHRFCTWYAWNAKMYPDHSCKVTPEHVKHISDGDVDVGLVFQTTN